MNFRSGALCRTVSKSGGACPALADIRQNSEVALFATLLGWLMTEEKGIGVWTKGQLKSRGVGRCS